MSRSLKALAEELTELGEAMGLDALGVAPARPFESTRRHLEERKAAGLHAGMQFTYRNPARATDPSASLPGARALVVAAWSYRRSTPDPPADRGPVARIARYSWSDQYRPLRQALNQLAARLVREGFRARVLVDNNALVDREAAFRAGLGWYGKNTNLLLHGRGSSFLLGSVLTDAPLPVSDAGLGEGGPLEGCGSCSQCLSACPTGALVAPGVLDARRCLAWLLEAPGPFPRDHREALGDRLYGCDDCQEVCPPNRRDDRRHSPPRPQAGDQAWIPILEVLAASDEELLDRFERWYVPQRRPRYIRRNALVVLGNTGDGRDPSVVDALDRALTSPDALIRAHGAWAALRLGLADLVEARLARERDPQVLEELGRGKEREP